MQKSSITDPSQDELRKKVEALTKENKELKSQMRAIVRLSDILLVFYKSSLVTLSSLNPNFPCANCAYRTSATTCRKADICKHYDQWKWKFLP